jgi:rhamnosyltransferase
VDILIILASYNGDKYIQEQIESIFSQEGVRVHIKIFDDSSTDQTKNIISALINRYKRIELIENLKPSGNAALNFINSLLSLDKESLFNYDLISLSDQDDIWLPNKLIKASNVISMNKLDFYMSNLTLWNQVSGYKSVINKSYRQKKFDYLFEGGSAGCTYVFTKDFLFNLQNVIRSIDFNNWQYLSHDWLFYFVARLNQKNVFIDDESHILYRIHESNVHGQLNTNSISAYLKRFSLIFDQWYFIQSHHFSQFLDTKSEEYFIYKMYNQSWFSRFWIILRYNFKLMRSRKKFIQFVIVSLIPRFKK